MEAPYTSPKTVRACNIEWVHDAEFNRLLIISNITMAFLLYIYIAVWSLGYPLICRMLYWSMGINLLPRINQTTHPNWSIPNIPYPGHSLASLTSSLLFAMILIYIGFFSWQFHAQKWQFVAFHGWICSEFSLTKLSKCWHHVLDFWDLVNDWLIWMRHWVH